VRRFRLRASRFHLRASRFGATGLGLGVLTGLAFSLLAGACSRAEPDILTPRKTSVVVETLTPGPGGLALPVGDGSVRFAVIGDAGRGDQNQVAVARQMEAWRAKFPFDFVLMLGDNIYGPHTPDDYVRKFQEPYRSLLDAGVSFYAAIGNHDDPGSLHYAPFNMNGNRYYTFRRAERKLSALTGAGVRFFALDSRSFDRDQVEWLARELKDSTRTWKIAFFHHPLYTSGRYRAGARALRLGLEPTLVSGDVDVVLAGHEHFYERIRPQHGIVYFVSGAAGSLRPGDIRQSNLTDAGFDEDFSFMLFEVTGQQLYFQSITKSGRTVDAGVIERQGV
jgi:predicted phosphodiesterase